ncbi:hypothetical protein B0H11DRAFT_2194451 [Mycena galericulata]|nr:hypothetical protein B0H11DRAFT_2194451 [Mycena galericulata]
MARPFPRRAEKPRLANAVSGHLKSLGMTDFSKSATVMERVINDGGMFTEDEMERVPPTWMYNPEVEPSWGMKYSLNVFTSAYSASGPIRPRALISSPHHPKSKSFVVYGLLLVRFNLAWDSVTLHLYIRKKPHVWVAPSSASSQGSWIDRSPRWENPVAAPLKPGSAR